jgi:hypothetical protein
MTALPPEERPPGRPEPVEPGEPIEPDMSVDPGLGSGKATEPGAAREGGGPVDGVPSDSGVPGDARVEAAPSRRFACPSDEVFELLANVVAFQASFEAHEIRRPLRGHFFASRRWRREHEVLLLQRQMLKLRIDATPPVLFAPFPRPFL